MENLAPVNSMGPYCPTLVMHIFRIFARIQFTCSGYSLSGSKNPYSPMNTCIAAACIRKERHEWFIHSTANKRRDWGPEVMRRTATTSTEQNNQNTIFKQLTQFLMVFLLSAQTISEYLISYERFFCHLTIGHSRETERVCVRVSVSVGLLQLTVDSIDVCLLCACRCRMATI